MNSTYEYYLFHFYKWNYTQYEQSQSDWCKKKVGHIMTIVNFI